MHWWQVPRHMHLWERECHNWSLVLLLWMDVRLEFQEWSLIRVGVASGLCDVVMGMLFM